MIEYEYIDGKYYIKVLYKFIDYIDEILFERYEPIRNKIIRTNFSECFNKCKISKTQCYIIDYNTNKFIYIGKYQPYHEKTCYMIWTPNDNVDFPYFMNKNNETNRKIYFSTRSNDEIYFYFKLENKKELAKFRLLYKE